MMNVIFLGVIIARRCNKFQGGLPSHSPKKGDSRFETYLEKIEQEQEDEEVVHGQAKFDHIACKKLQRLVDS